MNLDGWTELSRRNGVTIKTDGTRYALVAPADRLPTADAPTVAQAALDLAADALGSQEFFKTWNSRGWGRCWQGEDAGILAVIELLRDDEDDDERCDTPTLAWRRGEELLLLASTEFMDSELTDMLDLAFPAKNEMARVDLVYGE